MDSDRNRDSLLEKTVLPSVEASQGAGNRQRTIREDASSLHGSLTDHLSLGGGDALELHSEHVLFHVALTERGP